MKAKTPENNNSQWNDLSKLNLRNNLLKDVLDFNHVAIITAGLNNNNNKLKRFFQSINNKKVKTNIIDLPR